MPKPTTPRRPRRWWKALAVALFAVIGLLAALPWLIATGPGRSRVAAGLNRALAPGRLRFEGLHLSWFGPTRLTKVSLLDPKGETVATVPTAVLDKTLGQLILGSRDPSVLTLDGTVLEVDRSADGTINLADALQTLIAHPDPQRDLTIRINHGSLRYRDPFLAEPMPADDVDLTLHLPTSPFPLTWSLKLGQGGASLEVQGDFDRWLSKGGPPRTPELEMGIVGKQWPFVARTAGLDATGRLDGTLDFARKRGRWVLNGDARLIDLNARGKILSDDTLTFDRFEAGWDLSEGESGWTIRRLSLKSPLGELKAEGQLLGSDGRGKQRIEGKVDLAAIAHQLPHALRLRDGLTVEHGSARVSLDVETTASESTYDIEAKVSELEAKDHDRVLTLREPATLTGRLVRKGEDSSVEQLAIKTSFLEASAKGRFQDGVNLAGSLDLDGFRRQLGEWVDLGDLGLAGRVELEGVYRVHPAGSLESVSERIETIPDIPFAGSPQPIPSALFFFHRIRAGFRDLRIDGLGVGPIRRDAMSMNLSMNGPVDASGFPLSWKAIAVLFKSGESEARLRLDPGDDKTLFSASASTPLTSGNSPKLAQFKVHGDWSAEGRILTFADIACNLPRISADARGKLDLSSGELALESLPGRSSEALGLTPDGLRVSGLGKRLDSLRFEGGLSGDSAALDQLVADLAGRSPLGLSGRLSALANARGDGDGVQFGAKMRIDESLANDTKPLRPNTLSVNARYSRKLDRLEVSEFAGTTTYGTLEASGRLDNPMGARTIDLNGKLSPDFAAITALLVSKVEPGAKVEGMPSAFRATGSLGEWKELDAEFGFDLAGADIYGMKFGPSPVVLRAKGGKLSFDPISTSLNEGHIRLEPELDLDAPGGPMLRLAKNSAIREARINDEVSKRVLAYVAPVLDQATRASGLVSIDLDHAEFPIGPGRGRQAKVEGAVVFQDVEFGPGPLASDLLSAIGRRDLTLKLDQPVTLTIADGRINQRGMSIPIADFTRIELAGWVDFDRKLSLNATVPVTSAMLGNNPLLSDIAAGTKVRLPIGGTLDRPRIDREAFAVNLQELGKSLLTRGATRGALDLLMRLGRPKDPNAPPPPPRLTPDERRAKRQEKKAVRRGEIPPAESPRP